MSDQQLDPDQPTRAERADSRFEKVENAANRGLSIVFGLIYLVGGILIMVNVPSAFVVGLIVAVYGAYLVLPVPRWKFIIY